MSSEHIDLAEFLRQKLIIDSRIDELYSRMVSETQARGTVVEYWRIENDTIYIHWYNWRTGNKGRINVPVSELYSDSHP